MVKRILIDAAHQEETRLVLCDNKIVKAVDYQNVSRKSIKGNIYLAKVTRIEPSLQAAFVDYGGDRHGFLPFSEIHFDYYQLPHADKQELLKKVKDDSTNESSESTDEAEEEAQEHSNTSEVCKHSAEGMNEEEHATPAVPWDQLYKKYHIQDVIKKDQILLVQAVKEERGNKGAALTTYLTLAGRYCVMLPNSSNSSGISRKIEDQEERQRLKRITNEFRHENSDLSLIIRTAGAFKTKTEVKKDYSYLKRLWTKIRDNTLSSKAPAFIYEERDVIKRAIRDLYDSNVEDIVVAGQEAYTNARAFMKLILPRHIDKIKLYEGTLPLFSKFNIESQIRALYESNAPLPSGGYLVINQAEALIAIDINSGRSTSERDIESTALKTNLEAAEEIARQLRLRDLSGLIVIDFIDMVEHGNRKAVEQALKAAVELDKARIQIGKISEFGLLEMSRQRLHHSFLESNTEMCSNCRGKGRIRLLPSTSAAVLRALESELAHKKTKHIEVSGKSELIFYLLNEDRRAITELEQLSGVKISFSIDGTAGADSFYMESKQTPVNQGSEVLSAIDAHPSPSHAKSARTSNRGRKQDQPNKKAPGADTETGGYNATQQENRNARRYKIKKRYNGKQNRESRKENSNKDNSQAKKKADEQKSILKEIWNKITK